MPNQHRTCVYLGKELGSYNFGTDHPFGPKRHDAFLHAFKNQRLDKNVDILDPVMTTQDRLELFHTHEYVEKVRQLSKLGTGYLDQCDTPAFVGMYEATSYVVGTVCDAIDQIMSGEYRRAFIPIAGLHHARRHTAAGFCVFNDCGVAIEYLKSKYHLRTIAYVDIDAHHGDGVFYSFEDDPELIFVDLHEDGRYLYPGTGFIEETGTGEAKGTKLNVPMPPKANDQLLEEIWPKAEAFLKKFSPEFILLQCGADSLKGDPITHMAYSEKSHAYVASQLRQLADDCCDGKLLVMGGGGYNLDNIASAWTAVVKSIS